MKTRFLNIGFLAVLFLLVLLSCNTDKLQKQVKSNPKKHLTEAEVADLERASFDKLPDHNDSIAGCWMIDKKKSPSEIWNLTEIDAFYFFKEHKRFSIYDSTETSASESRIGFFRFYNNKLTFEITEGESFQDIWKIEVDENVMVAENIKNPKMILYLNRSKKKSMLSYK